MNLGGVDLPQTIIDAIDSGRLVIFAGAGVSMGAPSNLPSFWKLALDLADGTGLMPKELGEDVDGNKIYEPLDQFLGRLAIEPQTLKEKAARFTDLENPPNDLHNSLIRMFVNSSKVRIVTTNYDLMFESAVSVLGSDFPEVYSAPALPVGSNFEGIVHVHGSVTRPFGIVLTDSDFGRAYLTEGWARRFLVDVFSHQNVVLFVGYSHDDTVLQYLARALPDRSEKNRFALTSNDDSVDKWHSLGIVPIVFKKAHNHDYSGLNLAASELADFATRRPSEWQAKIGFIAGNSPKTADIEDEDVIRSSITDTSRTRFFTQKAVDSEWVPWLITENAFKPLFQEDQPGEHSIILADWLLGTFIEESHECVLLVLSSDQRPVKLWFWWKLMHAVRVLSSLGVFRKFFDYLLQAKPWNVDVHALQFLAERSAYLGDVERLLQSFQEMATHRILLKKPIRPDKSEGCHVHHEIEINSPHWNLEQIWNLLEQKLNTHAEPVLGICEQALLRRRSVETGWRLVSKDELDFDSYRRSAIEPNEQDSYPEAIDVIIDAARKSLEYLGDKDPEFVKYWIRTREQSLSYLIRRLAIHSIGWVKNLNSDRKINLLLAKGLFRADFLHEAFTLLVSEFPTSAKITRQKVVGEIGRYKDHSREDAERRSAQVQFDWLTALNEADPDCPEIRQALNQVLKEFEGLHASKHPDLKYWTEGGDFTPESPYPVAELLSENGPDFDALLNFRFDSDSFARSPSKSGLRSSIRDAADRNPDWGSKFVEYLLDKGLSDHEYFTDLLRAIGKWPEELEMASFLLRVIQEKNIQKHQPRIVTEIILELVRKSEAKYVCQILPKINEIATNLTLLNSEPPPLISADSTDWLTTAINSIGGKLAEYWVHALSIQINQCGDRALQEPYRSILSRLSNPKDINSIYAIPVFTQQLAFLNGVDTSWVQENLIPLFHASDHQVASQAWDGYLYSNGPKKELFELMETGYEITLVNIDSILSGKKKNRFIEFLAVAILWIVEDPNKAWVPQLINNLDDGGRIALARYIGRYIKQMEVSLRVEVWDSWLKIYWNKRLAGVPAALSNGEVNAMVHWLCSLDERFPEAVDLIISLPDLRFENQSPIIELARSGLIEKFPNDMAALVAFLLRSDSDQFYLYQLEGKILAPLSDQPIDDDIRADLDEALIASGGSPLSDCDRNDS